ncbi:hypothetical protein HDV57DRAFT_52219 [Trichoderma longibrachiatum]|uniref:Uncharacterized protein n=1 Tax=Trichoderma longibrachiatum ATCC 18648 TaxID=983965 RepID=A0A2T4C0F4_TRILO|nr:hypothetical protein M440DRAFT_1267672 [Trichoderma longibrachiatum ATCC 18648]
MCVLLTYYCRIPIISQHSSPLNRDPASFCMLSSPSHRARFGILSAMRRTDAMLSRPRFPAARPTAKVSEHQKSFSTQALTKHEWKRDPPAATAPVAGSSRSPQSLQLGRRWED